MTPVNRRGFLQRILALFGVAAVAPSALKAIPAPPPLAFHPDAFSLVYPSRVDVLYGYGVVNPNAVIRLTHSSDGEEWVPIESFTA